MPVTLFSGFVLTDDSLPSTKAAICMTELKLQPQILKFLSMNTAMLQELLGVMSA
jgi:hypothetical protein